MDSLKLQNQLCFPLYAASKEVIKRYTPFLDELGLTYTQYISMLVIWDKEKISVKTLGRHLFLDSGTLTPLIKRLEQQGLITRQRAKEDERSVIVTITKKGKDLKEKAEVIPLKIAECIHLTKEETVILYKLLYKILDKK